MTFQRTSRTTYRTACTYSCHKQIDSSVGSLPDLLSRSTFVHCRIGRIDKLSEYHGTLDFGFQLVGTTYCALHSFGSGCQFELSTVSTQQVATFLAHGVGHRKNHLISTAHTYPCKPHSCVSARRFDDGGTCLKQSTLLGIENHGKCNAVLHTAARVEILKFNYYACQLTFTFLCLKQWCTTNQVGEFVVNHSNNYL